MRQENILPPSAVKTETKLEQGFSQIMPVGWLVHTSAASGALLKAKPQGLGTVCAQGKERARSLVKPRGRCPIDLVLLKARYEYNTQVKPMCV